MQSQPGKVSIGGVGKFRATISHPSVYETDEYQIKLRHIHRNFASPDGDHGRPHRCGFTNSTMMVRPASKSKFWPWGAGKDEANWRMFRLSRSWAMRCIRGLPAALWPQSHPQAIQKYLEKVLMETTTAPEFQAKLEQAASCLRG